MAATSGVTGEPWRRSSPRARRTANPELAVRYPWLSAERGVWSATRSPLGSFAAAKRAIAEAFDAGVRR